MRSAIWAAMKLLVNAQISSPALSAITEPTQIDPFSAIGIDYLVPLPVSKVKFPHTTPVKLFYRSRDGDFAGNQARGPPTSNKPAQFKNGS